jgi:hypothetical protein
MANDRFLLIKAWSYILWADVEHVLSQLLIAELTDRIPVVYWPTYCLHNGFIHTNGFELYFEPVSTYTIFDVAKPEYTFYPPIWDQDNLLVDDPSRETWIYRNIGEMITCEENVLVGDVYFDLYNLIPFIKKDHPAYGMTVRQVYRYLFRKYIRVKPDINVEIDGFYNSWLRDNTPVLAVHVCKPDSKQTIIKNKGKQEYEYVSKSYRKNADHSIEQEVKTSRLPWKRKTLLPNQAYHKEIKKYIDQYDIKKILLLTNSEDILKEYRKKYGPMIIATQCKRMSEDDENSYPVSPMVKRRHGIEILKDTYLAAKCEFFIGNDFSSLSQTVVNMKEWPDSNVKLLYWQVGKKKYPINQMITTLKEKHSLFSRIAQFIKKLFKK